MKAAIPIKNGCLNQYFDSTQFFAILKEDGERLGVQKIIKVADFGGNHQILVNSLKNEGVDTVIAGIIETKTRRSLSLGGLEIISGFSGEIEKIAEEFLKKYRRL